MNSLTLYDYIGFTAPVFFTLAYLMTAMGKWNGQMARLHWCNLIGALAMLISLMHAWNLPMVVMEICWGSVAVAGLIKTLRTPAQR